MPKQFRELHRQILEFLTRTGVGVQVTLSEIRTELRLEEGDQRGLPRRIRELRDFGYRIGYTKKSDSYILEEPHARGRKSDTVPISGRLRAEVLLAANGRCGMCGQTISDDEIKLVVDHRVPRTWGGRTERENLWALCEKCNISKRDFFDTFNPEIMRRCMGHKEPIIRIGELLKAFETKVVPRQLLEVVGQDEQWTRRLRELRELGWKIEKVIETSQSGRYKYVYRLMESRPWPEEVGSALRQHRRKVRERVMQRPPATADDADTE